MRADAGRWRQTSDDSMWYHGPDQREQLEETEMSTSRQTFTSWLREQEYRNDATGQLAQFWRDHTPGRISAVAGVQKHLTALRDSPHSGGDLSAEAATCLAFLDGAVREYEAARSGRPPLAAVPDAGPFDPARYMDTTGPNAGRTPHGDLVQPVTFPVQPANVIALPDGTYVDTSATPWLHHVHNGSDWAHHPAGQCESCMPVVRAVVPEPAQEGLWPAEHAGDGTVPAAAADQVMGASGRYTGDDTIVSYVPSSPVREAVGRATAAGVQAAQMHAVSVGEHKRDPHPFDATLARIESKLDRVLALLGLDDESMAENVAAEIDPMYPDVSGGGVPYARPDSPHPMVHDVLAMERRYGPVPQADDFARLYELADFGEEG